MPQDWHYVHAQALVDILHKQGSTATALQWSGQPLTIPTFIHLNFLSMYFEYLQTCLHIYNEQKLITLFYLNSNLTWQWDINAGVEPAWANQCSE